MPRYRIIKRYPPVLEYRTTRYFLGEFAGMYSGWNWVARKDCEGYHVATLLRANSEQQLEEMRITGFEVATGTAADKIMQRLVTDKFAERLPAPDDRQNSGVI